MKMRKKRKALAIFLLCLFLFALAPKRGLAAEPQVQAGAALLMDGKSGMVLWDKNGYMPLPPASTLKILTAITALDMASPSDIFAVSANAAAVGESSVYIQAGEEWRFEDLLNGALIQSGNDAACAIAENIGGTEACFTALMRLKAASLGAFSGYFTNSNGLPSEEQNVSAYDIALFARYGLANDTFAEIVRSKESKMEYDGKTKLLQNTNKLLWQDEHIVGVKTGTTNAAGPCLVSAMEKDGRLLIAVVLNSPDRYGESMALLNYGMEEMACVDFVKRGEICAYVPVAGVEGEYLPLVAANDGCFLYPQGKQLYMRRLLPQTVESDTPAGSGLGRLIIEDQDGQIYGWVDLTLKDF